MRQAIIPILFAAVMAQGCSTSLDFGDSLKGVGQAGVGLGKTIEVMAPLIRFDPYSRRADPGRNATGNPFRFDE